MPIHTMISLVCLLLSCPAFQEPRPGFLAFPIALRHYILSILTLGNFTAKSTDENMTSENWELILNLCDKVQDEGQEGCVYHLILLFNFTYNFVCYFLYSFLKLTTGLWPKL